MKNRNNVVVTGLGVTSPIGQGIDNFAESLYAGRQQFDIMRRPGRQHDTQFIGAEIQNFECTRLLSARSARTASLSARVAVTTLHEAWADARLEGVDDTRIGLIVGGNNVQQRDMVLAHEKYKAKPHYLSPSYGLTFMDTDICGVCTSVFGIKGMAYTVGGASASGQLAIIEAAEAVSSGRVDICIAIGALMDLSYWECIGLNSLGAMATPKDSWEPRHLCRPFDEQHAGFLFGESCAALVLERSDLRPRSKVCSYGSIPGWSVHMDAERNPNPSEEGEVWVIKQAMSAAGLSAASIDYVNPHGSGSPIGDDTELRALSTCGLNEAYINTTKSITGHGLTSAGALEAVVTLLQMRDKKLHPSLNLDKPIDESFNWVVDLVDGVRLDYCLSLSLGFGGINTAVCFSNSEA